jgi:molecular chaperone DnaK (HSP70)
VASEFGKNWCFEETMTNPNYIGIDLGTTFSAIAYVNEHGVPEVIENSEGERTTPSVVLFEGNEVHVGSYAKDNMAVYPGQGVEFVKRFMGGLPPWSFEYNGRKYNASEISSFILKKLKKDAEEKLRTSIKDVVITVPAYFGHPQRVATIEAGEMAGLNVLLTFNEPTAAAYSFGLHKLGKNQRVLVFDLGGGTFDVSLMEISGEQIEEKGKNGDHQLGGKDWDEALIQYIAEKFEKTHRINPYSDEADYQTLKEKALAAKISLSTLPKVNVIYGCKGKTLKEEITRQKFEEITSRLVNQCRMLTELVLKESTYQKKDIDVVLLAGGSTRMPMVVNMLKDYFGKEPSKALNPDECVALGAALKAALLKKETWSLPGQKKTWALPSGMKDINVTSHSFGLAVLKDGELFNSIIIPKNTPYPCDREKSDYVTTYDDQETLDLYVLEGEAEDPRDCELVGSYQIYDIPKRAAGKTKLKVTYKYNQNQIVEVNAVDMNNNKTLPMRMIDNADLNQLNVASAMDIALLIDCSGSMSGQKIEDAQNAAIKFSDSVSLGQSKIGVISFGGSRAQNECNLTSDHKEIKKTVMKLVANGGNPMWDAIDIADNQIFDYSCNSKNIIIILADGDPGDANATLASAKRVKSKGVRIIAIGVGAGVDEVFLKKIVSSQEDYHFVTDSFQLSETFISIATQLTGSGLRK